MSLLPYSLSESIATHGWLKAWTLAKEHLQKQDAFKTGEDIAHPAIARALLMEPVTVEHKERGFITASFPAALAMDAIGHVGDHNYLRAVCDITQEIRQAFAYDFKSKESFSFPVTADQGMEVPGLGALWLVTWAHQPESIFQSRRKRGGSHTNLDWPNEYFIPAAGRDVRSPATKMAARTRLIEEAIRAYPLLRVNLGAKANHNPASAKGMEAIRARADFTSRFENALSLVLFHWRKEVQRDEGSQMQAIDRLTHRVIQSGCTVEKDDKWDFWTFVYGVKEDMNPSTRLTRAVNGVVFYLSPATRTREKWLEKIVTYLEAGGQLDPTDACHAERMARLGDRFPETLAVVRAHQAQRGFEEVAATKPARRVRPRS